MRPHRVPARQILLPLLLAALLVAGAACSSSDDGATGGSGSTTTEAKDSPAKTTTTSAEPGASTTTRTPRPPDSIDAGEDEYVEAMKPLIASATGVADAADGDCLAPKWVAAIGVDTFKDNGIAPEDLGAGDTALDGLGITGAEADEMVAAFGTCDVDLVEVVLAQITSGGEPAKAVMACLRDTMTTQAVNDALKSHLIGDDAPSKAFTAAQACYDAA